MTDLEKDITAAIADTRESNAAPKTFDKSDPIPAQMQTSRRVDLVIPTEVSSANVSRSLTEQLSKVTAAINSVTRAIDDGSAKMNALWAEMERNKEILTDLTRSEAVLRAAQVEAARPNYQRK